MTEQFSTISFTVHGSPKGKQRARFTRRGISYTPKDTITYESHVRHAFLNSMATDFQPYDGPVEIEVTSVHPIPSSWTKKKKALAASGTMFCMTKPDWDNIGKIVCDALNGVAFTDDARVASAKIRKVYGCIPATHVRITFMGQTSLELIEKLCITNSKDKNNE